MMGCVFVALVVWLQESASGGGAKQGLGRALQKDQLSHIWLAGLSYALAFARLGTKVTVDEPIKNDHGITTFTAEQLENPWGHSVPQGSLEDIRKLKPCRQVRVGIIAAVGDCWEPSKTVIIWRAFAWWWLPCGAVRGGSVLRTDHYRGGFVVSPTTGGTPAPE